MDFRIRSIDFTAAGREIVREREDIGDAITIGRAATNTIHLPDLAVEQQHVRITPTAGGELALESIGSLGFTLDGRQIMSAAVDPSKGAELGLGSYLLGIASEAGIPTFTVRRAEGDSDAAKDRLSGFTLAGSLPGKRVMSWSAVAVILIAFLAIPIFTHLTRADVEPELEGEGAVLMDASWSTGALSSVHHGLEDNCEACHVEPFLAVQDETCLTCHQDTADHAALDRIHAGMPEFDAGEAFLWNVAHAFGKPGPGACTDCHTEHEGAGQMEPVAQQFCSDCHETLDTRLADTQLGNAADFGELHPQFKALVLPALGVEEPVRMSLASNPVDWNGLRFPHDLHLDETGGAAQMAIRFGQQGGYGAPLQCSDCHTPTADGVRFLPVDMETSCESCHSLVYDRVGLTYRSLRHGDIAQVQADLMAADRSPRRPVVTGRRRPGQFAENGLYYGNFSRIDPTQLRADAMEPDGLCGECHLPGDAAFGTLAVAPVVQRTRYFLNGWFDHSAHTQEDCSTCHAAETSAEATDLLLPGIGEAGDAEAGSCRSCHEGEHSLVAEVPSTCAMCHSYHPREGAAAAPPRIAGLAGRGGGP